MSLQDDIELIRSQGGPTALALKLGYEKRSGAARVANWLKRGIPADVKVAYPRIFLKRKRKK